VKRAAALLWLTWLCVISGCGEPDQTATRQWAQYYVDRMQDTQPPLSTDTPAADSLVLDSATAGWTTDEWIQFWREVGKEQARRREAAERLAEENRKAELEREAEAKRQADVERDVEPKPDSVPAADST
jgi:hypothetical protein